MSDSEDSTVMYTTVSSPYEGRSRDVSPGVDGPPVMPKDPYAYVVAAFQALPPSNYVPGLEEPEQAPPSPPLPAAATPTTDSPGYIPESDLDEDPEDDEDLKEDPADYPADHDDDDEEEEPFGDDADKEDGEQDEDDDNEEEEHPPLANSIPPPPALSSPLILPIPLPAASPPLQLLSSDRRADRPKVTLPPRKRLSIVHCLRYEARECSVVAAARPIEVRRANYGFIDFVEAEIRRQRGEGHLATALGEIRALQAREQARAGALEGSLKTLLETTEANSSLLKGKMWQGHTLQDLRGNGVGQKVTCYKCGAQGHFKRYCLKLKNNNNNRGNQVGTGNAQARVYAVGNAKTNPDANNVTGTFFLNNYYAFVLFDTGADSSFVSTVFSSQFDIAPTVLDHDYAIELADGRIEAEGKSEKKRLKNVPIIWDFLEVFPEELPGLPPTRQVNKKEHEEHLMMILKLIKKDELYASSPNVNFGFLRNLWHGN
nr:hypothetical protein [Tanacetum cinerariifolium]GEZ27481.1 hypothetical protein [Tanacetum cinerariifolium]